MHSTIGEFGSGFSSGQTGALLPRENVKTCTVPWERVVVCLYLCSLIKDKGVQNVGQIPIHSEDHHVPQPTLLEAVVNTGIPKLCDMDLSLLELELMYVYRMWKSNIRKLFFS